MITAKDITVLCEKCDFTKMTDYKGRYVCKIGREDRACCLACPEQAKCRSRCKESKKNGQHY